MSSSKLEWKASPFLLSWGLIFRFMGLKRFDISEVLGLLFCLLFSDRGACKGNIVGVSYGLGWGYGSIE